MITTLHKHTFTEELYHITSGEGLMTLDKKQFDVIVGDTICIPPGTPHCIKNTGNNELIILCCCSPAYSHDDTQLLD
jgi:mannose-6-phosphate isomerase-like protein (cupin superfamily)